MSLEKPQEQGVQPLSPEQRTQIERCAIAGDMSGRDLTLLQYILRNLDNPNLERETKKQADRTRVDDVQAQIRELI